MTFAKACWQKALVPTHLPQSPLSVFRASILREEENTSWSLATYRNDPKTGDKIELWLERKAPCCKIWNAMPAEWHGALEQRKNFSCLACGVFRTGVQDGIHIATVVPKTKQIFQNYYQYEKLAVLLELWLQEDHDALQALWWVRQYGEELYNFVKAEAKIFAVF